MLDCTLKTAPRYTADTSAAIDGTALKTRGLLAGGYVATAIGWRPVEAIAAGDMVLTFDNGLCPLVEVRREMFHVADMMAPASHATVVIPKGALGNSKALELLPDQGVLIESEAACDAQGDPFAVVPAKALIGYRGITRGAARTQIEVFTLIFDDAQVIYMQDAILVHCQPPQIRLSDIGAQNDVYDLVPAEEAQFLIDSMMVEDQIGTVAESKKETPICDASFFNSMRWFYAASAS